ncbi:uncharacterized protein LOC134230692 [Saccostrea cucullata]|uniref:uncharacterized protein LOC134230692 n=1 Tax=Saccostrea cuccullata TaxID=36930 RepID=UPI002ED278B2
MQGNVLLVDPPGIGESEALTNILKEILPNAVAFIFMVNVSNSGGVQEDRLIEILKTIKNAAPQMLCFNPCDVLFATNKWDLIDPEAGEDTERHSDDSSDDSNSEEHVSDKEKLWDMIVEKIENVWMDCDKEQIFKLSLQKVDTATDTQEKREFQRFTDELSQIIERYKDKRVQTHLSFLEDLVFKIEKGILARIHSVETGNTHTLTEIQKTLKKINDDSNQAR